MAVHAAWLEWLVGTAAALFGSLHYLALKLLTEGQSSVRRNKPLIC